MSEINTNTTMWSNPTIPGTRIPHFRIRELADFGYTAHEIAHRIYDGRITVEQIREVLSTKDD